MLSNSLRPSIVPTSPAKPNPSASRLRPAPSASFAATQECSAGHEQSSIVWPCGVRPLRRPRRYAGYGQRKRVVRNEMRAVEARGPGRVALGSGPQATTAKENSFSEPRAVRSGRCGKPPRGLATLRGRHWGRSVGCGRCRRRRRPCHRRRRRSAPRGGGTGRPRRPGRPIRPVAARSGRASGCGG